MNSIASHLSSGQPNQCGICIDTKTDVIGGHDGTNSANIISPLSNRFCSSRSVSNNVLGNGQLNFEALECGHQYHRSCISEWMSRNLSCPTCRATINLDKISTELSTVYYLSKITDSFAGRDLNNLALHIYNKAGKQAYIDLETCNDWVKDTVNSVVERDKLLKTIKDIFGEANKISALDCFALAQRVTPDSLVTLKNISIVMGDDDLVDIVDPVSNQRRPAIDKIELLELLVELQPGNAESVLNLAESLKGGIRGGCILRDNSSGRENMGHETYTFSDLISKAIDLGNAKRNPYFVAGKCMGKRDTITLIENGQRTRFTRVDLFKIALKMNPELRAKFS